MSLAELDRALSRQPDEVAIGPSSGITKFHELDCGRVHSGYQTLPRGFAKRNFGAADCCH